MKFQEKGTMSDVDSFTNNWSSCMSLSSVKFWEELESLNNIDTGGSSYSNACPNAALRPFEHYSSMTMKNLNFSRKI